mmetsp:Transcript_1707/g.2214  ORF Transcript_1707/g.2214 Transcript_1707/m.2214 type:complete len:83 (-) Transcript_1707:1398-1646(-)
MNKYSHLNKLLAAKVDNPILMAPENRFHPMDFFSNFFCGDPIPPKKMDRVLQVKGLDPLSLRQQEEEDKKNLQARTLESTRF